MLTVLMYVAYIAFGLTGLLMVLAILLQEGKGGGLSALGGTQAESAFGSSNPIRRATVVLALIFFILAGVLTYVTSGRKVSFDGDEKPKTEEIGGEKVPGDDAEAGETGDGDAEEPDEDSDEESDEAGAKAPAAVTDTTAASESNAEKPAANAGAAAEAADGAAQDAADKPAEAPTNAPAADGDADEAE